jgi:hypothetical protein
MQAILGAMMGMGATTSELFTIPYVLRFSEAKEGVLLAYVHLWDGFT